jgi:hypothetical protein
MSSLISKIYVLHSYQRVLRYVELRIVHYEHTRKSSASLCLVIVRAILVPEYGVVNFFWEWVGLNLGSLVEGRQW